MFCRLQSGILCNVSLVSATMVLGKLLCSDVLFDIGFITCLVAVVSCALWQNEFAYELANNRGLMSLHILTIRVDNWRQWCLQTVVDLAVFAMRLWIMSTMCVNLCTIVIPARGMGEPAQLSL